MDVLLTNDDGIRARGLRALYAALKAAGHNVFAVAPMRQQSGVSRSLTVFEPLRSSGISENGFTGTGIFGTPADCVKLALGSLVPWSPDIVMAGINQGPNAGPDLFYSGTVAAAAEAAQTGVPGMAISHASHEDYEKIDIIARHAVQLAEKIDWKSLPAKRVINVNYPAGDPTEWRGVRVCRQSSAIWKNIYSQRNDPRGAPYWWLDGEIDPGANSPDSDRAFLAKGYVTVTPLRFEFTDMESLEKLGAMNLES